MDIKTFGVVGAGQMGNGIAQVAAMSGLQVIMNDMKTEFVEKGVATINKILSRGVEKGRMTDDENWFCFTNSKYDPKAETWDVFKRDYVQIIPD